MMMTACLHDCRKVLQDPAVRAEVERLEREEMPMQDAAQAAVKPQGRVKLGSVLSEIGRRLNLTEDEFAIFGSVRDQSPARVVKLE